MIDAQIMTVRAILTGAWRYQTHRTNPASTGLLGSANRGARAAARLRLPSAVGPTASAPGRPSPTDGGPAREWSGAAVSLRLTNGPSVAVRSNTSVS